SISAIAVNGTVTCEADDNSGGDFTDVNAGTGLSVSAGAAAGPNVTLAVDTAVIQNRVSGTCAAGSSISAIAVNGTVTCETDDDSGGDITDVNAGTGLTGGAASGAATLNIGFTDGELLDLSVITADTQTEGLRLPAYNAAAIADGQITWDAGTDTLYVGTSGTAQAIGASGGDFTDVNAGTGLSVSAGAAAGPNV
ncbi:MAG: hypothetical protein GY710_14360, partial [Desulfobacteraceae bacterium]|nr:hypothetical protein [Desulfobacteraceae bacterium]